MHSLVSNHPFIDGNKRVAVAAAELFLGINGYRLLADNATLEDVTLDAASGRIGVDEIRLCIEHRILRVWE